jgi:hypothetical protein
MVAFGSFSRQFVAFPVFGPSDIHFSAADPGELRHLMDQAEQHYRNT